MPAASHLAIPLPRRAKARRPTPDVAPGRPWPGRLGADPLVRRDRGDRLWGPGDQHRRPDPAVRLDHGLCTLLASLLVMAISPTAMIPPFRMDLPIRHGSSSKGRPSGMERITEWVYDSPDPGRRGAAGPGRPAAGGGMGRLSYETNFINAFKPQTRVVKDYADGRVEAGRDRPGRGRGPAINGPITRATLEKFRSVEEGLLDSKAGAGPRASWSSRWRRSSTPTDRTRGPARGVEWPASSPPSST